MRMKHLKAFTVIELLVAIAIIVLLSSIVLVSLRGAREQARLARAKSFHASVYHALGARSVGIWSFGEGSGTTARDDSGYRNDGTLNDPTNMWQTQSQCELGFGGCLSFDGASDYVGVADDSSLNPTNAITLVGWVKRMGPGGPPDSNRGIFLSKDSNYLDASTSSLCMSLIIAGVQRYHCAGNVSNGKWYHAAGTYNGTLFKIYVDGQEVFSTTYTGNITTGTADLRIGMYDGGGYFFNGFLDEVYMFDISLATAQVQQIYAEGLPRHQAAR